MGFRVSKTRGKVRASRQQTPGTPACSKTQLALSLRHLPSASPTYSRGSRLRFRVRVRARVRARVWVRVRVRVRVRATSRAVPAKR